MVKTRKSLRSRRGGSAEAVEDAVGRAHHAKVDVLGRTSAFETDLHCKAPFEGDGLPELKSDPGEETIEDHELAAPGKVDARGGSCKEPLLERLLEGGQTCTRESWLKASEGFERLLRRRCELHRVRLGRDGGHRRRRPAAARGARCSAAQSSSVRSGIGRWHRTEPLALALVNAAVVHDDALRHAQSASTPRVRESEVDLRGQRVRELVQSERSVVRKDAGLLGPQPDHSQVLMVARGEVDKPIDPTTDTKHPTGAEVMRDQLGRIAGLNRLLGGEEPVLGRRGLEEVVPQSGEDGATSPMHEH